MRKRKTGAVLSLGIGILLASSGSKADIGDLVKKLHPGPEVGAFFPTSGKTANRFGNTWFSFGIGFGKPEDPKERGKLSPDFDMFYQTRGSSHAFILPVGATYKIGFGKTGRLSPYAGAGADFVVTDIRSDQDGLQSRFRSAWGVHFFLGAEYSRHGFFEVRYFAITSVRSLDLSGVDLKAGYRF